MFLPDLCRLESDSGGRARLDEHSMSVIKAEVPSKGMLRDVERLRTSQAGAQDRGAVETTSAPLSRRDCRPNQAAGGALSMLRVSAGVATSRPTRDAISTIRSTCWAFVRISPPKRGMSPTPIRT